MSDGCRQSSESYLVFWKVQKLTQTIIFEFTSYDINSHLLGKSCWLYCQSDSTSLFIKLRPNFKRNYLTKVFALDKKGNPCYIQKYVTSQIYPPSKIWNLEKDLFMKDCENFITDDKVTFCVSVTDLSVINTDQLDELEERFFQTFRENDDVPCTERLSSDFSELRVSDADYDVVLKSGSQQFPAHKSVLSSQSKVFFAMFQKNMEEAKNAVVELEGMHPYDLEQFLKYIYMGDVDNLTEESGIRLYEIAEKYAVESLKKKCSDFLVEVLTPANAWGCLLLADTYNDFDFKESVLRYIMQRKDILKGKNWNHIFAEHPKLCMELFRAHVN